MYLNLEYPIVFINILALFRPVYWIFIMCLNFSCIYYQVNKYYVDINVVLHLYVFWTSSLTFIYSYTHRNLLVYLLFQERGFKELLVRTFIHILNNFVQETCLFGPRIVNRLRYNIYCVTLKMQNPLNIRIFSHIFVE